MFQCGGCSPAAALAVRRRALPMRSSPRWAACDLDPEMSGTNFWFAAALGGEALLKGFFAPTVWALWGAFFKD
jgi:hypothetical protein